MSPFPDRLESRSDTGRNSFVGRDDTRSYFGLGQALSLSQLFSGAVAVLRAKWHRNRPLIRCTADFLENTRVGILYSSTDAFIGTRDWEGHDQLAVGIRKTVVDPEASGTVISLGSGEWGLGGLSGGYRLEGDQKDADEGRNEGVCDQE